MAALRAERRAAVAQARAKATSMSTAAKTRVEGVDKAEVVASTIVGSKT